MSLSDVVSVSITANSVGVTRAGFGVPIILSPNADWLERVRTYSNLLAVAADFAAGTPEYDQAAALFSAAVKPRQIKIGRCANKPTQKYTVAVVSVVNATDYSVTVGDETFTFTSSGSATNDEIVEGLEALINASAEHTLTATTPGSAGSKTLVLTADTAGDFNAVEVSPTKYALLSVIQDHADPGLAADLAAIALEDNDWYFIVYAFNSKACVLAIAAYAEANVKLFPFQSSDSNNATLAAGADASTSAIAAVKNAAYARSFGIFHSNPGAFAEHAWVSRVAPIDPGGESWHLKTLAGVSVPQITATHKTNINAKNGTAYLTIGGRNVTFGAKTGAGEFIDVTRFIDWLTARISENVFAAIANADKIPFTDEGIAVVVSEIESVLVDGVKAGGLAANPKPIVTAPLAADVSTANKQDRLLPDIDFSAALAGAIHATNVTGVLSV